MVVDDADDDDDVDDDADAGFDSALSHHVDT